MRHAMSDILPEEIRWRGGKTNMNPNFLRGLLILDRGALHEAIISHTQVIEKYIDIRNLNQIYQGVITRDKVKIDDVMTVWKVVTLAYWLRRIGFGATATASNGTKAAKSSGWGTIENFLYCA